MSHKPTGRQRQRASRDPESDYFAGEESRKRKRQERREREKRNRHRHRQQELEELLENDSLDDR
jgi:hypothetical protein